MPVSYNYGQLQSQIAYELGGRTDLLTIPSGSGLALSPIQQAIQNSIAFFERDHFYFNELQSINNVSTVVNQEFYTSTDWPFLGSIIHIDDLWILVSSNRYTLNPRTEQYLDDISVNPNSIGQPTDYALYNKTLRLYSIPDGVYPVSVEGTQKFSTLAVSTDSNSWTTDAADLIKAGAKMDILENILKQTELADRQRLLIYGTDTVPGYIDALRKENTQRPARLAFRARSF